MSPSNNRFGFVVAAAALGQGRGTVGMSLRESLQDHLARVEFFLNNSETSIDEKLVNWFVLGAVYSAVSAFEIARTRFEEHNLGEVAAFITSAKLEVRHFELLDVVRVHDFHRGAVGFSAGVMSVSGPFLGKKSSRPESTVSMLMHMGGGGIEVEGHNASVSSSRILHARGFEVLDPATKSFVDIRVAVKGFAADLPRFIESQFLDGAG